MRQSVKPLKGLGSAAVGHMCFGDVGLGLGFE